MSLRLKTIFGVALIEAVLLAILLSLTLNYLRTTNFDGLDQRAFSTSALFASTVKNAVLSYDLATVESFSQELVSHDSIDYVAVFSDGGQLLSGVGELPDDFNPSRLERKSSEVNDGIFDVSSPIEEAGINFGSVWLGYDMSELNAAINDAKKWSTFIVVGEMTLVALFSYFLGGYLTQRLSELRDAADVIAAGGRDIHIRDEGKDELSTVSRAFKNMVDQIKLSEGKAERYYRELEQANATLETRVKKRTQALLDANNQLTATNERLKRTQKKLVESEKMASIGTMAAGVAHEINNPMASVNSNLQMCQKYLTTYQEWLLQSELMHQKQITDADKEQLARWKQENYVEYLDEDFNDSLNDAMISVERVRNIVTALQQYANQINQEKGMRKPVFLDQLLSECVSNLPRPEKVQVSLAPTLSQLPPLLIHQNDFRQLFTELIKNSIQACARQGHEAQGTIEISAEETEHHIIVSVADDGEGISDDNLTRIYDPFFTTQPVGQGMGLGLTFAYNIVHSHEGIMHIENHGSDGTTVLLTFPISILANTANDTASNA